MAGLMQGLEIARRALLAHQSAITVTGHNVANVSTPGFTRRRAILETEYPERGPEGVLGSGVRFSGVVRHRDAFIDDQIRTELNLAGRWEARAGGLSRLEAILNEPSDHGLQTIMNAFWDSWADLSNEPEDFTARSVVVERGVALGEAFVRQDQRLSEIVDASERELVELVARINRSLGEVAQINVAVSGQDTVQGATADFEDQRDRLLDELAREAGARHMVLDDGSVVVRLGGRTVVQGSEVQELDTDIRLLGGQVRGQVVFASDRNTVEGLTGRVGGLVEVREEIVPAFRQQLTSLARAIRERVNERYSAGPDREPFFRGVEGNELQVDAALIADPSRVAAGSSGDSGDNDIALSIAGLREARVMAGRAASFSQFYGSTISGVGLLASQARDIAEAESAALETLEGQRQATIGVNLDEELSRLLTSQRAYQAAARLFTTIDQMYQTLLAV